MSGVGRLGATLARVGLWLIPALAGFVLLAAVLLQTAWLRDHLVRAALDAAADEARVSRIEGRLAGTLTLSGLSLSRAGTRVEIRELELRAALPRVVAGGAALERLRISGLRVQRPPVDQGEADEPFTGFTSPVPVDIDHLLIEDARLQQAGTAERHLRRLAARVRLRDDQLELDLDELTTSTPELTLQGRMELGLTPRPTLRTTLRVTVPGNPVPGLPGPLTARIEAGGDLDGMDLRVDLQTPVQARIRVEGLVPTPLQFTSARAELGAPLALEGVRLEQALLRLSGAPEAFEFELQARLDALPGALDGIVPLELSATGDGDSRSLRLGRLQLAGPHGNRIEGSGRLGLAAPWPLSLELQGRELDAGPWLDQWRSRLDLAARLEGELQPLAIDLRSLALDGTWNGTRSRLETGARIGRTGTGGIRLELQDLDLRVGANQVAGRLSRGDEIQGELRLDLPRLDQLWPGLEGRASGQLRLAGRSASPEIELELEGRDLVRGAVYIDQLDARGRLGIRENDLDLAFRTRIPLGDEQRELSVDAGIRGNWPQLTARLEAHSRGLRATADLALDGNDPDQLRIRELGLSLPWAGSWSLETGTRLVRSPSGVRFDAGCLRDASASLCWSAGEAGSDGVRTELQLTGFELDQLRALHGPALALDGRLDALVDLAPGRQALQASTRDLELELPDPEGEALFADRIPLLELELTRQDRTLRVHGRLEGELLGRLAVDGDLELPADAGPGETRTDLRLELAVADLTPIRPLLALLDDAEGRLEGELRIRGRLVDPELDGRIELVGSAGIPRLGVQLDPVRATLVGSGRAGLQLDASAMVAGSPLMLTGQLDWGAGTGPVFQGRASGEAVPLVALPDLRASLSPDLRLAWDGRVLELVGVLQVPSAYAEFRSMPESGPTLSPDVVIHDGREDPSGGSGARVDMDLTAVLGQDVRVRAGNFEARLGGGLTLRHPPDGPLTARGRLEALEGGLRSHGESLRLRHGYLAFDGPIDNPAVDLLASREVGAWEVGIEASGYFSALETRLYSSPPVDEVTALTMLVTGRPPSAAAGADPNRIRSAAIGFGISRASPLIQGLAERIGIDELALDDPMDEESGAVVVGKRLTENLQARYTYGIHTQAGGLVLEYRVSDALSIRSEAGTTSAIDLIFRREFD
jgi:translocation and assembly module TamB